MQNLPPQEPVPSNYPRPNLIDDRQVLKEVAVAQRQVLLCVLCQFGIVILNFASGFAKLPILGLVAIVLALALLVFMVISVSRLARALGLSSLLFIICMFIPCVSLIALLILSQKATTRLQAAGLKVGLLGANPDSI